MGNVFNKTFVFDNTSRKIKADYQNKKIDFLASKQSDDFKMGVNLECLGMGEEFVPGQVNINYFNIPQSDFNLYLERGIKLFRVAFLWERLQPNIYGEFNKTYWGYLDNAVQYALSQGARIILDCHNYAERFVGSVQYTIGDPELPNEALIDFWLKLGKKYANNDNVHFCIMNEPLLSSADEWAGYMQELVLRLRDANIGNWVQVSGIDYTGVWNWFSSGNAKAYKNFYDPLNKTVFEVHQYNDPEKDGGATGSSSQVSAVSDVEGQRNMVLFTQWCRKKGFKAHLGECASTSDELSLNCYFNLLLYLRDNSDVWMSHTAWGGCFIWSGTYPFRMQPHSSQPTYPDLPEYTKIVTSFAVLDKHPPNARFHLGYHNGVYYGFKNLSDIFSFSRTSDGMARNKKGEFLSFKANERRITDRGYTLEKQRSTIISSLLWDRSPNLLAFDVLLKKGILAPDGTYNALTMTEALTNMPHYFKINAPSMAVGQQYVGSVYVKYIDHDIFQLMLQSASQNLFYDFNNPNRRWGAREWNKLELSLTKSDDIYVKNIGFGFSDSITPSLGHVPNTYLGTGKSTALWHAQIEPVATGELFSTTPIISYTDAGATRAEDIDDMIGPLLNVLNGDFTIIMTILDIPEVAVEVPLITVNGVNILKRLSNYSFGNDYLTPIQTSPPNAGAEACRYGRKVGVSVQKGTAGSGRIVVGTQGVTAVSANNLTIPTITTAKIGQLNGVIFEATIYDSFNNTTQLKALLDR